MDATQRLSADPASPGRLAMHRVHRNHWEER